MNDDDIIITISISEEISQALKEAVNQLMLSSNPRGLWSYTASSSLDRLDRLKRFKASKQHEEVNWMKEGF